MADGFEEWKSQHGFQEDPTYDLRGAYDAGLQPDERGHLSDQFKTPQHPTFSTGSVYHGKDGNVGGEWRKQGNGKWLFKTSKTNEQNMSPDQLKQYWDKVERGNTIQFQSGEKYVGGQLSQAQTPSKKQQLEYAKQLAANQNLSPDQRKLEFEKYMMGGVKQVREPAGETTQAQDTSDGMKKALEAAAQRRAVEDSIRSKIYHSAAPTSVQQGMLRRDDLTKLGIMPDPNREQQEGPAVALDPNQLTTEEKEYLIGLREAQENNGQNQ